MQYLFQRRLCQRCRCRYRYKYKPGTDTDFDVSAAVLTAVAAVDAVVNGDSSVVGGDVGDSDCDDGDSEDGDDDGDGNGVAVMMMSRMMTLVMSNKTRSTSGSESAYTEFCSKDQKFFFFFFFSKIITKTLQQMSDERRFVLLLHYPPFPLWAHKNIHPYYSLSVSFSLSLHLLSSHSLFLVPFSHTTTLTKASLRLPSFFSPFPRIFSNLFCS